MKERGEKLLKKRTELRNLREKKGVTVTSMAVRLKIGVSRYYMIENGERPASPEITNKIATILGVKPEDIFLPRSFTVREVNGKASIV